MRTKTAGKRLTVPLPDGAEARVGDQIATRRNLKLETGRGPVRSSRTHAFAGTPCSREPRFRLATGPNGASRFVPRPALEWRSSSAQI